MRKETGNAYNLCISHWECSRMRLWLGRYFKYSCTLITTLLRGLLLLDYVFEFDVHNHEVEYMLQCHFCYACGANVLSDLSIMPSIKTTSTVIFASSTTRNGEIPSLSKKFFFLLFGTHDHLLKGKSVLCWVSGPLHTLNFTKGQFLFQTCLPRSMP